MSSEFFQNKACPFFPCHDSPAEGFSCLFCYCPLYALGKRCGGRFTYLDNGVKDCSQCDFPHRQENYAAVLRRYQDILDVVKREDARP